MVGRVFGWGRKLLETAARRPYLLNDHKEQRAAAQVEMVETLLAARIYVTDLCRAAVALDWGFWHFGDFSHVYEHRFGELPSDTLRRKPKASRSQGEPPS
jgi:hypothetical protein